MGLCVHTAEHFKDSSELDELEDIWWMLKSLWLVLTLRRGYFTVSGLVKGSG